MVSWLLWAVNQVLIRVLRSNIVIFQIIFNITNFSILHPHLHSSSRIILLLPDGDKTIWHDAGNLTINNFKFGRKGVSFFPLNYCETGQ